MVIVMIPFLLLHLPHFPLRIKIKVLIALCMENYYLFFLFICLFIYYFKKEYHYTILYLVCGPLCSVSASLVLTLKSHAGRPWENLHQLSKEDDMCHYRYVTNKYYCKNLILFYYTLTKRFHFHNLNIK